MDQYIFFFLIAFFAALIGGSIGVGGGIISLPLYLLMFNNNYSQASLYSFIGMFFLGLVSVIKYSQQKTSIELKKLLPMLVGASMGLYLSMAFIQPFIEEHHFDDNIILNIVLVLLLLFISILLLVKDKIQVIYIDEIYLLVISIFASILSSVIGIGISSIYLPFLLFLYGMNVKNIPALTLSITLFVSLSSVLERILVLNTLPTSWWDILPIATASIIGAILGPMINKKINDKGITILNVVVRLGAIVLTLVSYFV